MFVVRCILEYRGTVNALIDTDLHGSWGRWVKKGLKKGDSEGTKKNKEKKEYNTKETTTNVVVKKRVAAEAATHSR